MSAAGSLRPDPLPGPRGIATAQPTLSDLNLRPGAVLLDRWHIRREIGRGTYGAVFEAEDHVLRNAVAVKVLDPLLARRGETLERFREEVVLLRRLAHRRIVRVFDYSEDLAQSLTLFAMELVQGGSLADVLHGSKLKGQGLDERLCLRILEQALEGLAAAHEAGIAHSDVTPSNILLEGGASNGSRSDTAELYLKLVDFGIGRLVDRDEHTERSQAVGTAPYVAPEVLGEAPVPPALRTAADLYGLGAIGYELATTRRAAAHPLGTEGAISDLPERLRPLLRQLLERDPARRPDATTALATCRQLLGSATPGRAPSTPVPDPAAHRRASPQRIRLLKCKLDRALAAEDPVRARQTLDHLRQALGPGADAEAIVGIAEAWLLGQ